MFEQRPHLFAVDCDLPNLQLLSGDVLVVDPASSEPVIVCREVEAEWADLRRALAAGQLRPSDPSRPLPAVLAVVERPRLGLVH